MPLERKKTVEKPEKTSKKRRNGTVIVVQVPPALAVYLPTKEDKGARTRVVNEALRQYLPDAAMLVAEQDMAALNLRIERLKKLISSGQAPGSEDAARRVVADIESGVNKLESEKRRAPGGSR